MIITGPKDTSKGKSAAKIMIINHRLKNEITNSRI